MNREGLRTARRQQDRRRQLRRFHAIDDALRRDVLRRRWPLAAMHCYGIDRETVALRANTIEWANTPEQLAENDLLCGDALMEKNT